MNPLTYQDILYPYHSLFVFVYLKKIIRLLFPLRFRAPLALAITLCPGFTLVHMPWYVLICYLCPGMLLVVHICPGLP